MSSAKAGSAAQAKISATNVDLVNVVLANVVLANVPAELLWCSILISLWLPAHYRSPPAQWECDQFSVF
jgi:hypothetical protein